MLKKKKGGELLSINIEEVSVVDAPANQRKFLFFKSDLEKAKADFSVQSDGTLDGTAIIVNGKTLEDLKSFYFSYYKADAGEEMYFDPVSLQYTLITADENGFKTSETYELAKQRGMKMNYAEMGAFVKALTGKDVTEEQFKKLDKATLDELHVLSQYEGQMPQDLAKAVGHFLKDMEAEATPAEPTDPPAEKSGLDDATKESLKAIADSITAMLSDKEEDLTGDAGVLAKLQDVADRIGKLEKGKAPKPDPKKKDDDLESDSAKILKVLEGILTASEDFQERLQVVEKTSGVKKGIDDIEGGGGSEEVVDHYTTVPL